MAEAVGAVRTEATFETAQFEEGTKRAQRALGQFDKATKETGNSLAAMGSSVQTAARFITAAFATIAGSAITNFITQSIQATAEIGRMARAAGLSTTEFQQWSSALGAASVSQEQMATSLGQFSRNLSDLNRGTGPFLQYLREAYPQLVDNFRGITDVTEGMEALLSVAERIADPLDRQRFLTQALGEAGSRLANSIPEVRRELERQRTAFTGMGDEAIKQAERIDREWNKLAETISRTMRGAVLATLNVLSGPPGRGSIADIEARIRDAQASLATAPPSLQESIRRRITQLEADLLRLKTIQDQLRDMEASSQGPSAPDVVAPPRSRDDILLLQFQADLFIQAANGSRILEQSIGSLGNAWAGFSSEIAPNVLGSLANLNIGMMSHADIVAEAQRRIQAAYGDTMEAQLRLASITQQMNLRYQQQQQQTAQAVGKALVDVFPKSKAAAAAQALINTAVGVTQALTLPFPLNWIQAAAVLASGMAQVAAIRSASVGGGGALPSPGGGGSGGGGGEGQGVAPTRIVIEPVDPRAMFSGEQLNNLIGQINERAANGTIVVSNKLI